MSVTFEVSSVAPPEGALARVSSKAMWQMRGLADVEACGGDGDVSLPLTAADIKREGRDPEQFAVSLGERAVGLALNGFIAALDQAFNRHYPLVLSPDDVWITIAQGFAHHVNLHAEALRARFVRHDGKVKLSVRRDDFRKNDPANPWPEVFGAFSDQIAAHLGKKRDLVVADFSTTTPTARAVSEIALMDAVQAYFDYEFMTLCGIPRVTLLGTVEDWKRVRTRAENLAEFELGWWVKALRPVLDEFVRAASGQVDAEFWRSIYKLKGASGGPYVTGWCNALFPYVRAYGGKLVKNESAMTWREGITSPFGGGPTPAYVPNGLSVAPFVWNYLGRELAMEFVGGFVGLTQAEDLSVRPCLGWAVRERNNR